MQIWKRRFFWLLLALVSFAGGSMTIWSNHPTVVHSGESFGKLSPTHVGGFWLLCGLVCLTITFRERVLKPGEVILCKTFRIEEVSA